MSRQKKGSSKDLDREWGVLRDLIEKENETLRKMIESLEALEKKRVGSKTKKSLKKKKSG
jgi:hypothetical protein